MELAGMLLDRVREAVVVTGEDGSLVHMNAAANRLFGPELERVIGTPTALLDAPLHGDDGASLEQILAASGSWQGRLVRNLRGEVKLVTIARIETVFIDGRDHRLWFEEASDLVDAIGRDITHDKEREAALTQAQKMEALGQLTGGITHDFNNLLQAIGGYLELIRNKPDDVAHIDGWACNALMAAERGTKLTEQLLTFSRSRQIDVGAVAISPVITQMHDLLERTLGPVVRIRLDLAPAHVGVIVDRNQFEVALLNLAINARDAMPAGGDLTITTKELVLDRDVELPRGNYVEVRVTDTGTGMSSSVAKRAFDPFFTTKGVGKGTGLGLSQVNGMARQAGGTARVNSRPGRGTTVSLLLRRSDPLPAPGDDARLGRSPEVAPSARVLVIDDDADVRQLLSEMLRALGYGVATAQDGLAGLAAIDRSAPDVLLLDFAMPCMDGAEVAKIVKETRPDLPIIFASGHADTALVDAVAESSTLRLRKPFRMDDLATVLAKALPRRHGP